MMTLTYQNKSVILRDPDYENIESFELSRINSKTRGGDLIIFRDPNWPTSIILDYHISYLSEKQTRDFLEFLQISLGQDITLLDFEGRTWVGIITTPTGEIIQPGRENKTAHFSFQGNLV